MRASIRVAVIALISCGWAGTAGAQSAPAYDWTRGTTISGFGGFGSDATGSGSLFGGSVGWDVSPRVAIEGAGGWMQFDGNSDTFSAALKARVNILGPGRAVPFVSAGIGLYHASFEMGAPMPDFYASRIPPQSGTGAGLTFNDPSVVLGGGVTVAITRVMRLRPDVDVSFVVRDAQTYTVPTFRLHLVFVFEDHPVTPSRRR
jgi:hypothetical protein